MAQARFRWVTVQRALDLLVADHKFTNATAIACIEEIGCGPDDDRLTAAQELLARRVYERIRGGRQGEQ